MAMSKSIARAQDVMVCQLCESNPQLKWKCIDCGLLMCSKCTEKVHPKFKNSKDHTILDIKQLGQIGIQKEIDINNVHCKTHAGQTCFLFCISCKILVCAVCIAKVHTGHNFEEIKDVSDEDIENLIKGLQNIGISRATKFQLKEKRQFTTKVNQCHDIHVGHNGLLWIYDAKPPPSMPVLQNIQPQEQKLHILVTIDTISIWDFRILSTGDVLVADRTSTLKIINAITSKVTNSKFNVESLFVVAVHVTDDDKVLVAARSTESAFPVIGRRVVIMMDNQGRKEAEWEYDNNDQQIFSCPRCLTCSEDGKIFVIDYRSEDLNGRIVVLNHEEVVNTYEGYPYIIDLGIPFEPSRIVNTPSDNIIVCEFRIDVLHYLNNSGEMLFIFDTSTIDIERPYCLTFVDHDTMYIGCTTLNVDSPDKAKLYELEFSET